MDKRILMLLAEGFEEMEAVVTADICIRAGIDVCIAGIGGIDITGAHGISLIADCEIDDIDDDFDAVVIPGGMPGAENVAASESAMGIIRAYAESGKLICAICASPAVVLGSTGILSGRNATCFPGFEERFGGDVKYSKESVVVDANVITADGPASAAPFASAIVKALTGKEFHV